MNESLKLMYRRWLLLLCLVSSAAARPSYSKWVVSAADFHHKAAPAKETWERGTTPFIGTQWYQYTYRSDPIFLRSTLEIESTAEDAHNAFVGGQLARNFAGSPTGWVKQDLTKQIKAGDESFCNYYSGKGGEMWLFTFRQGRLGGIIVLTGIHVEKSAFQKLVSQWTRRARSHKSTLPAGR